MAKSPAPIFNSVSTICSFLKYVHSHLKKVNFKSTGKKKEVENLAQNTVAYIKREKWQDNIGLSTH